MKTYPNEIAQMQARIRTLTVAGLIIAISLVAASASLVIHFQSKPEEIMLTNGKMTATLNASGLSFQKDKLEYHLSFHLGEDGDASIDIKAANGRYLRVDLPGNRAQDTTAEATAGAFFGPGKRRYALTPNGVVEVPVDATR